MYHPDELDIRIIREVGSLGGPPWTVRVSYAAISKRLGVDEETVRLRVKRARAHGAFPSWTLMVNPRLLGCSAYNMELDVRPEANKEKVLGQLRLVDGVTKIVDYRGPGIQVALYSPTGEPLARRIGLIESLCGSQTSAHWTSRFPPPTVRMRRMDWRILRVFNEEEGRAVSSMAKRLGVSPRTVQRRLSAMSDGRAVFLLGTPKTSQVGGLTCCYVVFCPDGPSKRSMDSLIRAEFSRIGHMDTSPVDYSHIGIPCENLAEADRILARLRSMVGVERAGMHIMKEMMLVSDWLRIEIERRAAT